MNPKVSFSETFFETDKLELTLKYSFDHIRNIGIGTGIALVSKTLFYFKNIKEIQEFVFDIHLAHRFLISVSIILLVFNFIQFALVLTKACTEKSNWTFILILFAVMAPIYYLTVSFFFISIAS